MFYAIYHPYGIRMMSLADTLYAYESKAQRAKEIDRIDWQFHEPRMEPVTRDEARALFPRAFDVDVLLVCGAYSETKHKCDYYGDCSPERTWWRMDDANGHVYEGYPTGRSYAYMS